MNITIKALHLVNFKGAKDLLVEFSQSTQICGSNATGKTRIFDAFTWLLTGKDSEDKKDFSIKPLTSSGEPDHRTEVSVQGDLFVDGIKTTLKRVYVEKWQKKKGEESPEFTGHETQYYVNGVPCLQKEYLAAVDAILPEVLLKLLTNPLYFASMAMIQRREILTKMVPVDEQEIYKSKAEFITLLNAMEGKPLIDFLKILSQRKKKTKDALLQIPPRIDELKKTMPPELDYEYITTKIYDTKEQIKEIEKSITSKMSRYESRNKEMLSIKGEIQDLEFKHKDLRRALNQNRDNQIAEKRNELSRLKLSINNQKLIVEANDKAISGEEIYLRKDNVEIQFLRDEWTKVNEMQLQLPEGVGLCAYCGAALADDVTAAKKKKLASEFNANKLERLGRINPEGQRMKTRAEERRAKIEDLKRQKAEAQAIIDKAELNYKTIEQEIDSLVKEVIPDSEEMNKIQKKIDELKTKIEDLPVPDTKELNINKENLNAVLDKHREDLGTKDLRNTIQHRIDELLDQEKHLAQSLADDEKLEFIAEGFEKIKMDLVEKEVNARFSLVKFRMFNKLINGGTEPACDILINGVPFPDANNAAKINSGMDIINALSEYYQTTAPIFIDNAEAVNLLIPTKSQTISLHVTEDPELVIKHSYIH